MKIGIISQGSNGDAEIFVSLALSLVKRKHEVELFIVTLNKRDYSFLNEVKGIKVNQKHVHEAFKSEKEFLEFWKISNQMIFDRLHDIIKDDLTEFSYKFAKEKDIVLGAHHIYELACIAEKFNTPHVSVNCHLQLIRTDYEVPFSLPDIEGMDTKKLWDISESYYNVSMKRQINRFRKEHGLAPVANVLQEVVRSRFLNLIPYSKHLYKAKPDWDDTYQMSGYWKTSAGYNEWEPSEDLANFMEDRLLPVFITVGSMAEHEGDSRHFQSILLKAAHLVPRKVIILTHWEEGNCIEANVYKLKGFVSYPKIFNKCSLVVHHGGVGALHHTTEAGCPSVVIKYGHDQPYNAKVLFDLGISSGSIHRKDLNAEELARLINEALANKQMKEKAEELALLLKNENGVENAVEIIEHKLTRKQIN